MPSSNDTQPLTPSSLVRANVGLACSILGLCWFLAFVFDAAMR